MRRGVALLACAVALVVPAFASAEDPPFVDWNPLLPGFPLGWQPSQERDCADGSRACIERTLAEMYRRFDRLYATCDHNSVFALVYIRVTEGVRKAVIEGLYEEPAFLNHEDAVFARMYFAGFDAWERGERERVPPAWRAALDAGRERSVAGIGNLLMSMNAHVNRDMPFMLAALGLTKPDGASRKPDHDRGNRVLHPLYDDVFEEIARRWDPSIMDYDLPLGTYDNLATFQILQGWREQVWRHAEMLSAAPTPELRKVVADYIEGYALGIAEAIKAVTRTESAARDQHCAAYQRGHPERGALARPVLRRRGLRVRRGFVRVRLACPPGLRVCDGELRLERLGRPGAAGALARARFDPIAPGRRRAVRLRVGRARRRATRVRVLTSTPWGLEVSTARRARLRRR